MIEIICRESLQQGEQDAPMEKRRLPKNIRQVGSPRGRHKIYIEDYVYTYIQGMARKEEPCAAIFFGTAQVDKDIRCTFVSGAVECSAAIFKEENIHLDDSFWDYVYKEKKQFFPDLEIVGWFLGEAGMAMNLPAAVESAHRKYFAGRDKFLMLVDTLEGEEVFFVHEQGYLQKREGYYIYYEKNVPMQEYMVSKREEEQQWDKLAEWEFPKKRRKENADTKAPVLLWEEIGSQEAAEEPRKGEFADLYQDLQELEDTALESPKSPSVKNLQQPMPKGQKEALPQKRADDSFQSLVHSIQNSRKESIAKGMPSSKEGIPAKESFAHTKPAGRQQEAPEEKIFAKSSQTEPKTQAEEALESYRNMVLERHSRQIARQNRNFLYTASSFFLVILCVMGITTINNYHKMQEVEETLHILKASETEEGPAPKNDSAKQEDLIVESIESQVRPLDDSKQEKQAQPEAKDAGSKPQGNSSSAAGQKGENADEDAKEASAPQKDRARYYTVQPGDTLDSICLSIYDSLDVREELCQLNGIEDGNKIFTGQKLQLP